MTNEEKLIRAVATLTLLLPYLSEPWKTDIQTVKKELKEVQTDLKEDS